MDNEKIWQKLIEALYNLESIKSDIEELKSENIKLRNRVGHLEWLLNYKDFKLIPEEPKPWEVKSYWLEEKNFMKLK